MIILLSGHVKRIFFLTDGLFTFSAMMKYLDLYYMSISDKSKLDVHSVLKSVLKSEYQTPLCHITYVL